MVLVDSQVEGCLSRLYHIFRGRYMILYYIYFEVGEQNICRDYVFKLGRGGGQVINI